MENNEEKKINRTKRTRPLSSAKGQTKRSRRSIKKTRSESTCNENNGERGEKLRESRGRGFLGRFQVRLRNQLRVSVRPVFEHGLKRRMPPTTLHMRACAWVRRSLFSNARALVPNNSSGEPRPAFDLASAVEKTGNFLQLRRN